MREAGKGSKTRPTDNEAYADGWDRIFGSRNAQDLEVEREKTHRARQMLDNARIAELLKEPDIKPGDLHR